MTTSEFTNIFTKNTLNTLFPAERADDFFDALFGDAEEGAYDICLAFDGNGNNDLRFAFHLNQRPGKCLACNLTYGLPEVFRRHPIINVAGLVREIEKHLDGKVKCVEWHLGPTREISRERHVIPLTIKTEPADSGA